MAGAVQSQTQGKETAHLDCIHCGLCLSVCPTYLQISAEPDSPRGRIYMIEAMQEGRIDPTSAVFQKHMYLCLECRACETACPSGVRYSLMMNDAREEIRKNATYSRTESIIRRIIFNWIFPHRRLMHWSFRMLRFYQISGIQRLVRASRILRLFSEQIQLMESLLPEVPAYPKYSLPRTAPPGGRSRVSLFEGCIMPELFGSVHEATIRVLERNGVSICLPRTQTCCGALHLHDGEIEGAKTLAKRNIEAFENDGSDFVVVNAAGCGAMLREYGYLLKDDPAFATRAAAFSGRVRDISEFLDALGIIQSMARLELKVTYDDPCHLLHAQGIKAAPRNLLRAIPGLQLIELQDAERCCGSAGIYNITQPEMARRILEEKIRNLARTQAQVVATGNPGCLLQIRMGLKEKGLAITAVHPIELLDQAYRDCK